MSTTATGSSISSNTPAATVADALGGRTAARLKHEAMLKLYFASPARAAIFEPYLGIAGERELPGLVVEPQCDGVKRGWHEEQMMRLSDTIFEKILKRAAKRHSRGQCDVPAPPIDRRAKKYGVDRSGSRDDNKILSELVGRGLAERYHAMPLLNLLDQAKEAGENEHDMLDALLLALQNAMDRYVAHCKTVLPRRKRGEKRPDAPPLAPGLMRGTVRRVGVDPGTRNMAVSLLEVVNVQAPPDSAPEGTEPEPLFRLLLLDLVDLEEPTLDKAVKLHYAPASVAEAPVWRPAYDKDVATLMREAMDVVEAKRAMAAERKRKRAEAAEQKTREDEGDAPVKNKNKRQKSVPASIVINLVEDREGF